jgi:outer membrane protein assembly factor BamA
MIRITSIFHKLILTSIIVAGSLLQGYSQAKTPGQYQLRIIYTDKDSSFNYQRLDLQSSFANQPQCADYIKKIPALLALKGWAAASIDSLSYDSSLATIYLWRGPQQVLVTLDASSIDKRVLELSGFDQDVFDGKPLNIEQLDLLKSRILNYYEKNGFPFAAVALDSIQVNAGTMKATLKVTTGPLYHIDSIRVKGSVKLTKGFLQRYLGIPNGSVYNKERLEQVSKRLLELPYLQEQQPSELMMLGTGSILNLYLLPKKSSQVNFLIGFLPANNQTNKLQLTGDVNLDLRNALGAGEKILLNWQQLQLKSPRLNIGYQHPFIFKSAFGFDFGFDLFKKDSTFLQLSWQIGVQYLLSVNQSGKIFFQNQSTILLGSGVDTNRVKATRQLPANIDVKATNLGLDYEINTTNYRFNPRSGNEIKLVGTIGIKTIDKNNEILSLKDPAFNFNALYDSLKLKTYQLRARLTTAHYFPFGKQSTLKAVFNGGIYGSQSVFRNELFQIGGYRLLRGFDEESIYASKFGVATLEYRNLIKLNSYLFTFVDAGWIKNKYQSINASNNFLSGGIGLVLETKAGLLNMSFAVGKRGDVKFDLRQAAKIHFGYINYF